MASAGFSSYELSSRRVADCGLPARERLAPVLSSEEHLVLLAPSVRFERLLRQDDLLDDGVAAVFTLVGGTAELVALAFSATRFSPAEVAAWLTQRRFRRHMVVPIDPDEPAS